MQGGPKQLCLLQGILPLLKAGVAMHHSGLLPILKEVVEILFQEHLIKVRISGCLSQGWASSLPTTT